MELILLELFLVEYFWPMYVSIIYITLEINEFSKNAYNKFILSWIDKKIDLNILKF